MKQHSYLILSILTAIFLGCDIRPDKINFGSDMCHYCKMSIVDAQHASQVVTVKGKSFKYDAIECMLNHLNNWDQAKPSLYLVSDYDQPKSLIDATKAHYLITPDIPSPMGEYLSAFEVRETRDTFLSGSETQALDWNGLLQEFKQ